MDQPTEIVGIQIWGPIRWTESVACHDVIVFATDLGNHLTGKLGTQKGDLVDSVAHVVIIRGWEMSTGG